jgi:hypothetical protein
LGAVHLRAYAAETHLMTAPRICRNCGSELSPDIRWCPRCYEPERELTPRAPIHAGDFVGSPIHERGDIPRWSRWEKSATTFGPVGRVIATSLLFATLLAAVASGGLIYVITFPVVATVLLREIWAKGWVVPDEPDAPARPSLPTEPLEPPVRETITVTRIVRWTLGLAAIFGFTYGPIEVKAGVVGLCALALLWWFCRAFDS